MLRSPQRVIEDDLTIHKLRVTPKRRGSELKSVDASKRILEVRPARGGHMVCFVQDEGLASTGKVFQEHSGQAGAN
ncbi:hypothetical protein D3C77_193430 [compost metagenome]